MTLVYDDELPPSDLKHMEDHAIVIWAQGTRDGALKSALAEVIRLRKLVSKLVSNG